MKKNKILNTILITACIFFTITPIIHWMNNPDVTQMQLVQKFWLDYLLAVIFGFGFVFFNPADRYGNP